MSKEMWIIESFHIINKELAAHLPLAVVVMDEGDRCSPLLVLRQERQMQKIYQVGGLSMTVTFVQPTWRDIRIITHFLKAIQSFICS